MSVFGALTLYILSMISLLMLRKKEPNLDRPFKVPFFPFFPYAALVIASVSLVAMALYNLNDLLPGYLEPTRQLDSSAPPGEVRYVP